MSYFFLPNFIISSFLLICSSGLHYFSRLAIFDFNSSLAFVAFCNSASTDFLFDPSLNVLFTCSALPHEVIVPSFLMTSPSKVMISLNPGTFLFLISKAVLRLSQIIFPLQNYSKKKSKPSKFASESMISIAEVPPFPTFSLIESLPFGFFTFPRMIKVLMAFIFLSLFEICSEDA